MLLNYHIGRFVLASLFVGDLVRLGLSSVLVASDIKLVFYSSAIKMGVKISKMGQGALGPTGSGQE